MLERFLSDCRDIIIAYSHIYQRHFGRVDSKTSYFTIDPDTLFDLLHRVLGYDMAPDSFRMEGPQKITLYIRHDSPIGYYAKLAVNTCRFAIVIAKCSGVAVVRTCYPDGL